MDIAIWVGQILLALAFGLFGVTHTFQFERASAQVPWVRDVGRRRVFAIGILELLGAIGVVLPYATGVMPWLTVAAAAGIVALMTLAAIFHILRREWPNVAFNIVAGAVAAIVVNGRLTLIAGY